MKLEWRYREVGSREISRQRDFVGGGSASLEGAISGIPKYPRLVQNSITRVNPAFREARVFLKKQPGPLRLGLLCNVKPPQIRSRTPSRPISQYR